MHVLEVPLTGSCCGALAGDTENPAALLQEDCCPRGRGSELCVGDAWQSHAAAADAVLHGCRAKERIAWEGEALSCM